MYYTVMDSKARFVLYIVESKSKDKQNSIQVFGEANEMTNSPPLVVTSDRLDAIGFNVIFGEDTTICHVSDAHIKNQHLTNNIHERFNSTTRGILGG